MPYANFTNYNEGEVGNYFFINEKYYPARQLLTPPGKKPALNETALRQVLLLYFLPELGNRWFFVNPISDSPISDSPIYRGLDPISDSPIV